MRASPRTTASSVEPVLSYSSRMRAESCHERLVGVERIDRSSCSSTPAVELAIRLRDLRGMTEGFGPLPGSQNMAISSAFT